MLGSALPRLYLYLHEMTYPLAETIPSSQMTWLCLTSCSKAYAANVVILVQFGTVHLAQVDAKAFCGDTVTAE